VPTKTYAPSTALPDAPATASAQDARPENSPGGRQLGRRGADRVLQVGRHHFAHLRAVSEGLSVPEAAARYLGIDHGLQARSAHAAAIDAVRALARRAGHRDWRLIGLVIGAPSTTGAGAAQSDARPSLEAFIDERGLHDWSEAEAREFYEEAFPVDQRAQRRYRLRERQMQLLRALETSSAVAAAPHDRIDTWFDPVTSQRLGSVGLLLLSDLAERIALRGRWWQAIPAVGAGKAARIAAFLKVLLPAWSPPAPGGGRGARSSFALAGAAVALSEASSTAAPSSSPPSAALAPSPALPRATSSPHAIQAPAQAPEGALLAARTDADAMESWIDARAGSGATARSYRREARRLLLWLHLERGRGLRTMTVDDCRAYAAFLEHVPPAWISRAKAQPLADGWAPFRGPLSVGSRRLSLTVLASFFDWLVAADYLPRNPWALINRKIGDAQEHVAEQLDTRAFTPEAWAAILGMIDAEPPSPGRARMQFILRFVEATGLRSAELVSARLAQLRRHRGGWVMAVHGKGDKTRVVAVPEQARQALEAYLAARQLPSIERAPEEAPLLASTADPMEIVTYSALYKTVKVWLQRAIDASPLQGRDRELALRASPHWLRHTFGTRAVERDVPLEVVQRQLGHADPRTTSRYSRAQLERLQAAMDRAFGGKQDGLAPGAPGL